MAGERVLLDANVLYANFVRDLLLSLFAAKIYEAKWTDQINDEWVRHLLENRTSVDPKRLERTVSLMNEIKPCPLVSDYEHLIESLELPDVDDRHVLAAAIASRSQKILTWNLKDFPARFLHEFGIEAENPDRFLARLIIEDPEKVVSEFRTMRLRQRKPKMDVEDFLEMLLRNRLTQTHALLEHHRDEL